MTGASRSPVLTAKEALSNHIDNDVRNLDTWVSMSSGILTLSSLACLLADVALRWAESTAIDKELARRAEANLRRATDMWKRYR
jgi:hypothetical protein